MFLVRVYSLIRLYVQLHKEMQIAKGLQGKGYGKEKLIIQMSVMKL